MSNITKYIIQGIVAILQIAFDFAVIYAFFYVVFVLNRSGWWFIPAYLIMSANSFSFARNLFKETDKKED